MISKSSLDHSEANRILTACLAAAASSDAKVSIAVVDDAGQLICFGRMDGARGYTVELASRKARTAAAVGVSTRVITEMSRNGPGPANDAAVGSGGVPVMLGSTCAGAIGVSGALPDTDERIAAAGASTLA